MDCIEICDLGKLNLLSRLNEKDYCKLKQDDNRYLQKEKKQHFKLIKKYIENLIKCKGKQKFLYKYSEKTPQTQGGRLYCPSSIQGLDGIIRGYLYEGSTTDIDMKNAHPKILSYLCKLHGYSCPHIDYYINNREEVLCKYGDRDEAKRKILAMFNTEKTKRYSDEFLTSLDKECKKIQKLICARDDYMDFRKSSQETRPENILGSHINRILCYYENLILQEIVNVVNKRGIDITAYMFDGLLIRGNHYDDEELLKDCEEAIEKKFPSLKMKLDYKEHSTIITDDYLNELEVNEEFQIVPEREMAEMTLKKQPNIKNCLGQLYIFDETNGMYRTDVCSHRNIIFESCVEECGKLQLTNQKLNAVVQQLKDMTVDDDWLENMSQTSLGYMLYKNGYFSFKERKFISKFNPNILFMYQVPFNFKSGGEGVSPDYIKTLKYRFFIEPLGEEVGLYFLELISRGFAGDLMKAIVFCIGVSNSGKSTLVKAIKLAIGQYAGTFNAECFAHKPNSSQEDAQKLRWALLQRWCRILASNELDTQNALAGNMIKKVSSGGDGLVARVHGGLETKFIPHFLTICMMNDMTDITPYDSGLDNRCKYLEYKKTYVEDVNEGIDMNGTKVEFPLQMDKELDKEMNTDRFKEGFNRLLVDTYLEYMDRGKELETPADCVRAKQEWGSGGDVVMIKEFVEQFRITDNDKDFVTNKDLQKWLDSNFKGQTIKKLCSEISKYITKHGLKNVYKKSKKIDGKSERGWIGITDEEEEEKNVSPVLSKEVPEVTESNNGDFDDCEDDPCGI